MINKVPFVSFTKPLCVLQLFWQDDHGPLKSAEDVLSDLPWLEEHVKQVTRMLPGGLEVLGLAIVDPGSEGGIVKKQNVEKILQFANAGRKYFRMKNLSR